MIGMPAKSTAKTRTVRVAAPQALALADAVNAACPWSGEPLSPDSLTLYKGEVVGFCNPGCRDKFEKAVRLFDALSEERAAMGARRR
jgi:hypothetical protein